MIESVLASFSRVTMKAKPQLNEWLLHLMASSAYIALLENRKLSLGRQRLKVKGWGTGGSVIMADMVFFTFLMF